MRHTSAHALLLAATAASTTTADTVWQNATTTHLPAGATQSRTMDAEVADLNSDGHPDIVPAVELCTNVITLCKPDATLTYPTGPPT